MGPACIWEYRFRMLESHYNQTEIWSRANWTRPVKWVMFWILDDMDCLSQSNCNTSSLNPLNNWHAIIITNCSNCVEYNHILKTWSYDMTNLVNDAHNENQCDDSTFTNPPPCGLKPCNWNPTPHVSMTLPHIPRRSWKSILG